MANIVLIGMPGSGKTSIGKCVASKLSMPFIDIDKMVVDMVKMPITDIFELEGEEKFRKYETLCTAKAVENKNTVISCGGGIILKEENMNYLRKEGTIFFLDRPLAHIMQSSNLADRPLVQNNAEKLELLYHQRIELYRKYAMHIIENNSTFEELANRIIQEFQQEIKG